MLKKFLIAAVAAGSLLSVPASAGAAASPATLADVLLADSAGDDAQGFDHDWSDYDIVTQAALLFPDIVAAASDTSQSITAFLPTDRAFRRLAKDLVGGPLRNEGDVFATIAGLGTDTVKTVLTYHLILGAKIDYATALKSDGAVLATLQGGTLTVDVRGSRWCPRVRLVDNDPDARDARVIAANLGGEPVNGFAHGIDRVLRPIDL